MEFRQNALASAPTLSPSPALDALTTEKETAENALFKAIDSAIANEIDEVQERSKAVDAAINSSSLVTLSSIIVSCNSCGSFWFVFFSVHLQSYFKSKASVYPDWKRRLCYCLQISVQDT